jgi:hypothetical protein
MFSLISLWIQIYRPLKLLTAVALEECGQHSGLSPKKLGLQLKAFLVRVFLCRLAPFPSHVARGTSGLQYSTRDTTFVRKVTERNKARPAFIMTLTCGPKRTSVAKKKKVLHGKMRRMNANVHKKAKTQKLRKGSVHAVTLKPIRVA